MASQNWRVETWFPTIDSRALALLKLYFEEIQKWNRTINLISKATLPDADRIHFADSILALRAISIQNSLSYGDLGAGNGFPGLVAAIIYPKARFWCIESDVRKAAFIQNMVLKYELKNTLVINDRVENVQARFDFVFSRGFASVAKTLELAQNLIGGAGAIFHFKGSRWKEELEESRKCSTWNTTLHCEYTLPNRAETKEMRVVLISCPL